MKEDPQDFVAPAQPGVTHTQTQGVTGRAITQQELSEDGYGPSMVTGFSEPLSKDETIREMDRAMAEAVQLYVIPGPYYGSAQLSHTLPDSRMLYAAFEAFLKAKRLL